MVAGAGFGAQGGIIFRVEAAVAIQGDEGGGADVNGVGAQGDGLGHVGAAADATGDDELDFSIKADVFQGGAGFTNRSQGGDAGMVLAEVGRGAGAAFHA